MPLFIWEHPEKEPEGPLQRALPVPAPPPPGCSQHCSLGRLLKCGSSAHTLQWLSLTQKKNPRGDPQALPNLPPTRLSTHIFYYLLPYSASATLAPWLFLTPARLHCFPQKSPAPSHAEPGFAQKSPSQRRHPLNSSTQNCKSSTFPRPFPCFIFLQNIYDCLISHILIYSFITCLPFRI